MDEPARRKADRGGELARERWRQEIRLDDAENLSDSRIERPPNRSARFELVDDACAELSGGEPGFADLTELVAEPFDHLAGQDVDLSAVEVVRDAYELLAFRIDLQDGYFRATRVELLLDV